MLGVWNLFEGASINGNTRCQLRFGNPAYLLIKKSSGTNSYQKQDLGKLIESQLNLDEISRRAKSKLET